MINTDIATTPTKDMNSWRLRYEVADGVYLKTEVAQPSLTAIPIKSNSIPPIPPKSAYPNIKEYAGTIIIKVILLKYKISETQSTEKKNPTFLYI